MRSPTTDDQVKKVHYNWPQRRGAIVRAQYELLVAFRGFGKTSTVFSERISHNAFAMNRSLGALVTPSYKKFLTQFVSNFIKGLRTLGYEDEKDYFIGDRGPRTWALPHSSPKEWDHAIHWRCGSGTVLISQDGKGAGNGFDLDYICADEGKLLNGEKFEADTLPALRGNELHFRGMSEHYSVFVCTDRPMTKEEKWVYRYRALYTPEMERRAQMILALQYDSQIKEEEISTNTLNERKLAKYNSIIAENENLCNSLRKGLVYYHEGSVIDNIEVYGLERLRNSTKGMSHARWRASILNEEVDQVEGGFYPDFVRDIHTYAPAVTSYTTARGHNTERYTSTTCLHDAEIMPDQPLEIAFDYGGKMNCVAVGQVFKDMLRIDNALHVLHPHLTVDIAKLFCSYYADHRRKQVRFYFDHTAKMTTGQGPNYRQIIVEELRRNGWNVIECDIGRQPSPEDRYKWWSTMLRLRGRDIRIMWNGDNCSDMITAIGYTQLRDGPKGLEKNKNIEKNGSIEEQVHAPHFSDAMDTLAWGVFKATRDYKRLGTPGVFA